VPIIKCPGCGGQLSTSAPACPRCQHVPTEEELSLANSRVGPEESRVSPVVADTVLSDDAAKAALEGTLEDPLSRLLERSRESHVGRDMVAGVGVVIAGVAFFTLPGMYPGLIPLVLLVVGIVGALIWWLKG